MHDLSSAILDFFFANVMPILQNKTSSTMPSSNDWLSKDVTVQLAKSCLGNMLNRVCEEKVVHLIDSEDAWIHYFSSLRCYLWPETMEMTNNEEQGIQAKTYLALRQGHHGSSCCWPYGLMAGKLKLVEKFFLETMSLYVLQQELGKQL